jgi:hypothetical protein
MAMNDERNDPEIAEALIRLRGTIEVPPVDPQRERALLAAFDSHFARPRPMSGRLAWAIPAGLLVAIAATLNWLVIIDGPRPLPRPAPAADDLAGFVPVPGAAAWPPFESGVVMRVDLPVSALPALGLPPPSSALGVVEADIIVAQDGFARAVRLVQ